MVGLHCVLNCPTFTSSEVSCLWCQWSCSFWA